MLYSPSRAMNFFFFLNILWGGGRCKGKKKCRFLNRVISGIDNCSEWGNGAYSLSIFQLVTILPPNGGFFYIVKACSFITTFSFLFVLPLLFVEHYFIQHSISNVSQRLQEHQSSMYLCPINRSRCPILGERTGRDLCPLTLFHFIWCLSIWHERQ